MKQLILLTIFVLSLLTAVAQSTYSGQIRATDEKGIGFITITLESGNQHFTAVTDALGHFTVTCNEGTYSLILSALGYHTQKQTLRLSKNKTNLGIFYMKEAIVNLEQAVVMSKPPLMKQEIDKLVINTDAMLNASSGNVLDLLDKTPGIMVQDGNSIVLNGFQAALVLIDGRPTYMSGEVLANYLRSLPAENVQKLELMSNPPAKYDADGAAIINIVLKKKRTSGFAGTVGGNLTAATHWRNNTYTNLNYNTKKLFLSGNLSYGQNAGFDKSEYNRTLYNNEKELINNINQNYHTKFRSNDYGARIGADYEPDSLTSFGGFISINETNPFRSVNDFSTIVLDNSEKQLNTTTGKNNQFSEQSNKNFNLHAKRKFQQERELRADFNYIRYNQHSNSLLERYTQDHITDFTRQLTDRYNLPTDLTITSFQMDYIHPVKDIINFEAGLRSSMVNTGNTFEMQRNNRENGEEIFSQQNFFKYKEGVHAAYATAQKSRNRWAIKAGVRAEYTDVQGNSISHDVTQANIRQNYLSIFPSLFLSYALDSNKSKNIVVSINRRIRRPGFQQLNPFLVQQDDYNYSGGNPGLRPQYMNSYELRYQHKSTWNISLMHNIFTDIVFSSMRLQDSIFVQQPENIAKGVGTAINIHYNQQLTGAWRISANASLIRLYLNGNTFGEKIVQELFTARFDLTQQFRISKSCDAEITFIYRHKDLNGQTRTDPRYRINAAIRHNILKGRGSIRLYADDIFYTWRTDGSISNIRNSYTSFHSFADSRIAGLSFNYQFGKKNQKKIQHADTSSEDRSRINAQ